MFESDLNLNPANFVRLVEQRGISSFLSQLSALRNQACPGSWGRPNQTAKAHTIGNIMEYSLNYIYLSISVRPWLTADNSELTSGKRVLFLHSSSASHVLKL